MRKKKYKHVKRKYIYFKSYIIVSDVFEVEILDLNPVGVGRDPV